MVINKSRLSLNVKEQNDDLHRSEAKESHIKVLIKLQESQL